MDGFHRLHDEVEGLLRTTRKGKPKVTLPPLVLTLSPLRSCALRADPWGGIFGQFPRNAAEAGLVKITGNSRDEAADADLPSIIDYDSNTFWMSKDEEMSFIQFEFLSHSVILVHYSIRTGDAPVGFAHLRSWTVRAVNGPGEWTDIDVRYARNDLNGPNREATFQCSVQVPTKIIRIVQTAPNHSGGNSLLLRHVEFFGTIM
jgi:hypothetical protein